MDLLRRTVFVEAPPSGLNKIKGTDTRAIVSVLLECRRFTHPSVYSRELLDSIGPALAARRDDWGIDQIELYRPVAVNCPIVFFMELTRRYRWAKWLCGLKGQPLPPRYTLSLCPRYDAILEIRFKDAITPAARVGRSLRRRRVCRKAVDRTPVAAAGADQHRALQQHRGRGRIPLHHTPRR